SPSPARFPPAEVPWSSLSFDPPGIGAAPGETLPSGGDSRAFHARGKPASRRARACLRPADRHGEPKIGATLPIEAAGGNEVFHGYRRGMPSSAGRSDRPDRRDGRGGPPGPPGGPPDQLQGLRPRRDLRDQDWSQRSDTGQGGERVRATGPGPV